MRREKQLSIGAQCWALETGDIRQETGDVRQETETEDVTGDKRQDM